MFNSISIADVRRVIKDELESALGETEAVDKKKLERNLRI